MCEGVPPETCRAQGSAVLSMTPRQLPLASVVTGDVVKPLLSAHFAVTVAPVIAAPTAAVPDSAGIGSLPLSLPHPPRTSAMPAVSTRTRKGLEKIGVSMAASFLLLML